jgi:ATP-dependent exoDNAse (exonuclease V) beta subunit
VERSLSAVAPDDRAGPLSARTLARLAAVSAAARGRLLKGDGTLAERKSALVDAGAVFGALAAETLAGPQKAEVAALVADAEARYASRKRSARAVDFDDLLVLARDLLSRDAALRAELRGRFRAFLVDEYQDVNGLQQEILDLVCGPGDPPGPVRVAVGDPKQSIYRFRGADVSVFARLLARFAAGQGRVLALQENHRSAPGILDLVNEVSSLAMRPAPGTPPRDDEIAFADRDRLLATRPAGAGPPCEVIDDGGGGTSAERRRREARGLAGRIRAIVTGAAGVAVRERAPDGTEQPRRPRWGDVAILFRRLTRIGEYERALRKAGIPYRLARGGGFYQAPEVRDAGELLATLFEPNDAGAWAAVLRSPMCAVSDGTLFLLGRVGFARLGWLEPEALAEAVARVADGPLRPVSGPPPAAVPSDEWERLVRFLDTWRDLRSVRDRLALPDLLRRAVSALDLDAAHLAAPGGERRLGNLEKVIGVARRFEQDGGTAAELAEHLRAMAARPPREPEADLPEEDAVAILSVHQAKGLEWPIVLVPDLGAPPRPDRRRAALDEEGRLCLSFFDREREAWENGAALVEAREEERRAAAAESRRLLYVAMTRARDHLVLSGEAGRAGDTWRALVEAALAARPELARRIPLLEAASAEVGPQLGQDAKSVASLPQEIVPPSLAPAPAPAAIRTAVTDLAEYARCPRRHWFSRTLGLAEPRAGTEGAPDDDPARATARGTLAHAFLAEADLGAPPLERHAQHEATAARRGYDPSSRPVRRIAGEVSRFLDGPAGRALAAAAREGRLRREVPFLLRLDSAGVPGCYLVGAIDALVEDRRGALTVVDYKYAVPRAGAADRYRVQLAAYALAASRAHAAARVRARLQFLRGDGRSVEVTPSPADLQRFATDAPRLAWAAFRGEGERLPAELGRTEVRCRGDGCGYLARCYPRSRPASPESASQGSAALRRAGG